MFALFLNASFVAPKTSSNSGQPFSTISPLTSALPETVIVPEEDIAEVISIFVVVVIAISQSW